MNGLYVYFSKGIIPYIHVAHSDSYKTCEVRVKSLNLI